MWSVKALRGKDGSHAGSHALCRPAGHSTQWILFLEGGGWCYGPNATLTIASCAHRAGDLPPSGQHGIAGGGQDYGGILGADPVRNPDFYTWNAAFLHYCDGASFGSSRPDPITVKDRQGRPALMWMRGRNNFDALIADLQERQGMSAASEIILSGGSAGGLAVFYNLDHLAEMVPGVKLTGFPDAGYFLDAQSVSGEYEYRANFQGADPVWNVTQSRGTNLHCLESYPTSEHWKCLMAPYILPHVQTPVS